MRKAPEFKNIMILKNTSRINHNTVDIYLPREVKELFQSNDVLVYDLGTELKIKPYDYSSRGNVKVRKIIPSSRKIVFTSPNSLYYIGEHPIVYEDGSLIIKLKTNKK